MTRLAPSVWLAVASLICACHSAPDAAAAPPGDEKAPETAADLKAKVVAASEKQSAQGQNEALAFLHRLEERVTDPAERTALGLDELKAKTVEARDTYFRKHVQLAFYRSMQKLIVAKAREKSPAVPPAADAPGKVPDKGPAQGSLAAARQWAARDLTKLIVESVGAELGLKHEEIDRYWMERSGKSVLTAAYGTGTFIVVKRPKGGEPHKDPMRPKTETEWWELLHDRPMDRAHWLTAYFVESSGLFEIVRVDESDACSGCGGRGVVILNNKDGTQTHAYCPVCNGATKLKKVLYR